MGCQGSYYNPGTCIVILENSFLSFTFCNLNCIVLCTHHVTGNKKTERLCIKVGRGQGDACVGTWDLGTRDEGLEDARRGT